MEEPKILGKMVWARYNGSRKHLFKFGYIQFHHSYLAVKVDDRYKNWITLNIEIYRDYFEKQIGRCKYLCNYI